MAKTLFKTCLNPKCKYSKCWFKAPECEKCEYSFILGRMPRKKKVFDDDDDDAPIVITPEPEVPVEKHKTCPICNNRCWYKAPECERCEYDFDRKESKSDKVKREQEQTGAPAKFVQEPVFLGHCPRFINIKPEPWMDDFKGPWKSQTLYNKSEFSPDKKVVAEGVGDVNGLRHWLSEFNANMRRMLDVDELYKGAAIKWVDGYSKNPFLKEALSQLRMWTPKYDRALNFKAVNSKCDEVWLLTQQHTSEIELRATTWAANRINVDVKYNGKVFVKQMTLEEAEKHIQKGRFVKLVWGTAATQKRYVLVPDNWDTMSDEQVEKWVSKFYGVAAELPQRIMTKKRR